MRSRFGAEAIAPLYYGGPMGLLANGSMDKRFFHRLGASRVDASPLCAGVSGAAWESVFGDVGGIAHSELAEARLIVVWGNNITTCNLHLTTLIREARKRGARLVVVDPKRIRIAREADLHLPLLPGTDVVLAYAVAAELERMGGLDQAFIREHVLGAEAFLEAAKAYPVERADVVLPAATHLEYGDLYTAYGHPFLQRSAPRRFILVSPASERRINSTFGGLATHRDDLICEMHPEDAATLSLSDGCPVVLYNHQGEVQLPLAVTDAVRPGTVFVPKGAWLADSPTGQTVNALIPGHRADLAGGACYYDCTVDVRAAG